MKLLNPRILGLLFILAMMAGLAPAQSKDRDHPTKLKSNQLNGNVEPSGDEYFYSFLAQPGELTLTADVKANGSGATVTYELLDENGSKALLCCVYAQGDGAGSGRQRDKIRLAKRQLVILHITQPNSGGGTFQFRFSGPGAPYPDEAPKG